MRPWRAADVSDPAASYFRAGGGGGTASVGEARGRRRAPLGGRSGSRRDASRGKNGGGNGGGVGGGGGGGVGGGGGGGGGGVGGAGDIHTGLGRGARARAEEGAHLLTYYLSTCLRTYLVPSKCAAKIRQDASSTRGGRRARTYLLAYYLPTCFVFTWKVRTQRRRTHLDEQARKAEARAASRRAVEQADGSR